MMMTNGFGAILGSYSSGLLIKNYFTLENGTNDWFNIWLTFSIYSLIIAILFALFFKHNHQQVDVSKISH
jgi:NHS family xanthosine MFS transporter